MKSNHPYPWTKGLLDLCWIFEVTKDDDTVALLWLNPVAEGVIECHACAAPEWHGRWITRSIVHTIADEVRGTGVRAVIAQITDDHVRRIWRRLGFSVDGNIAILEFKE